MEALIEFSISDLTIREFELLKNRFKQRFYKKSLILDYKDGKGLVVSKYKDNLEPQIAFDAGEYINEQKTLLHQER